MAGSTRREPPRRRTWTCYREVVRWRRWLALRRASPNVRTSSTPATGVVWAGSSARAGAPSPRGRRQRIEQGRQLPVVNGPRLDPCAPCGLRQPTVGGNEWKLETARQGEVRRIVDGSVLAELPGLLQEAGGSYQPDRRSEEHTSELQSPCNLVCRLLLDKKKHTS